MTAPSGRLPPLAAIPPDVVCLQDYAALARARMSDAAWAYLEGGAADELTVADNRAGFDRLRLRNRVLRAGTGGSTEVTLFGHRFAYPVLLAPVAHQQLAHDQAELATALGASAMQAGMVVSTLADVALEAVAQAASAPLWFQLYIQHDREFTVDLVRRAESAGYQALVVTVDAPVNGLRNRAQRAGPALQMEGRAPNLRGMSAPPSGHVPPGQSLFDSPLLACAASWVDIQALCARTRLPVLLKGITHPEDACRAIDAGAAGVIVSNHGGRVLDTQVAAIDALPAVADAVAGRVPLLLDGGIRRGSDVFKALALGARAVLVGRPYVHALAAAGAPGVAHVLHLLRMELETTMILCGCRTLDQIDRGALQPS